MRKFLYLFLVIGLAGCTEGLGVGIRSDVRGTYTLTAINSRSLPYTLSDYAGRRQVIYGGTLRMESNGYFTETLQIEETEPGRVSQYTDRWTGTYEQDSRGVVVLYYDEGGIVDGDYTSRELTLYGRGQTVVYRR